jgi:two-component sensor histidine kinase
LVPAAKRGFGTVIVGAMIEKQLKGHLERTWTDDGIAITIEVPTTA